MRGIFDHSMSVGDAIGWGSAILDESDVRCVHSRADSMLLLRHVLGIQQAEMFAYRERHLSNVELEKFQALSPQRAQGKPIQYITGVQEFFGLPFHVTPDVLIPRPETEHLVEAVIERLRNHPAPRIADVGTGSGAIAVALAHALPHAQLTALDISTAALALAAENAKRNGVAERIRFLESDLLTAVAGEHFDAIVSNPPYIANSERTSLPAEVRDHEPAQALFSGPTGLEVFERLIQQSKNCLKTGSWLIVEMGQGQQGAVTRLLQGWNGVEIIADLQGIPRVTIARKR